jgi:hypothetical protein
MIAQTEISKRQKQIFKNKKNIILIYFQVKKTFKNNRYHIFKLKKL